MTGSALEVLARIRADRPAATPYERCEMCAAPIPDAHPHVVNLGSRSLLCTCRACYLLFTDEGATLAYRAVPERYLSFPALAPAVWDELQLPVGTAFLFVNSQLERVVAFYPGPAGATESALPLDAWGRVVAAAPALATLRPDVEAVLVRAVGQDISCFLVPIDACYELVGHLRRLWRGFDGGQDVHRRLDEFFEGVAARSKPVTGTTGTRP
jgi:hypothetical protein